jgi:hypothetical protein
MSNSSTVWCTGCGHNRVQPRYGWTLCRYCTERNTSQHDGPKRASIAYGSTEERPSWHSQLSTLDVTDLDGAVALIEQQTGQPVEADKLALIRAYLEPSEPAESPESDYGRAGTHHQCPRMCLVCRDNLDHLNSNARTCGPACRKAWSRWSRTLDTVMSHFSALRVTSGGGR